MLAPMLLLDYPLLNHALCTHFCRVLMISLFVFLISTVLHFSFAIASLIAKIYIHSRSLSESQLLRSDRFSMMSHGHVATLQIS